MHTHKGFALITVVLVSALLVASAFMFARSAMTERHIGQSNAYYQLALDMAEAGLARAMQDMRTTNTITGDVGGQYLLPIDFEALKDSAVTRPLPPSAYAELGSGRKVGTYQVWATRTIVDAAKKTMGVHLVSEGQVFSANVNLDSLPTTADPVARRLVEVSLSVTYGGVGLSEDFLNMAAFSGLKMTANGAIIRNGDVYSNTEIVFNNSGEILGTVDGRSVTAQAWDGVTKGGSLADPVPTHKTIPFPEFDRVGFRDKAWGFVTGGPPFDGLTFIDPGDASKGFYPNTGSVGTTFAAFQSAIDTLEASYAPHLGDEYGPAYHYLSDAAPAMTFLSTLQTLIANYPTTNAELLRIQKYAVFYFFTTGKISWTQGDWMTGTFFIDGEGSFTGHSAGGNPGLPAVYVTGPLKIDGTPGTRFEGLIVAGSFESTSNISISGAVWTEGTMTINNGGGTPPSKILFDPRIADMPFPFNEDVPALSVSSVPGSWRELKELPH